LPNYNERVVPSDTERQPAGLTHLDDQLPLMLQKALHPVWREKRDVEANLEKRERF
jgi:hypothetical protein